MTAQVVTFPEAFEPLLAPRRYKAALGGRGSAKSHSFAMLTILRCVQAPTRVVCIREVQNTIRDSVRQLLVDKIAGMGVAHLFEVLENEIRGKNGSLIIFRGMRDMNALGIQSLEGFDIAWCEEAQSLSQRSLDVLRPTIRKEGSEMWFSYNPRRKSDPVDVFFRGPVRHTDAIFVTMNWSDNPFLPNALLQEKNIDYLRDPVKAQHVWDGGYEVRTEGAYYGRDLVEAENAGRVARVPYDREAPVHAAWDLGVGDSTAIVVFQRVGLEWHVLNYYESSGKALDHYLAWTRALPYSIDTHYLPHDARQRELQSGKSREHFFADRGLRSHIVPNHAIDDGIHAVRMALPKTWIDSVNCERLVDCLRNYRSEFSDKLQTLKPQPLHDEYSHGADAFRYMIMGANTFSATRSNWDQPLERAGAGVA